MQQYKIKITALAEQDIENAGDYIAFELFNVQAAIDTVNGIRAKINKLKILPERNELDDDRVLAEFGVRKEYYNNYKIYYVVDSSDYIVYIIRILHMRMDSKRKLYKTLGLTS